MSREKNEKCQSLTNDGTQCKRNSFLGGRYCWQHESSLVKWLKSVSILGIVTLLAAIIGLIVDASELYNLFAPTFTLSSAPTPFRATNTPTPTFTFTLLPTYTPSPTITGTATLTFTVTASQTTTPTFTFTSTHTQTPIPTPTIDPYESQGSCFDYDPPCMYTVKPGDSYSTIAYEFFGNAAFASMLKDQNRYNDGTYQHLFNKTRLYIPSLDAIPPLSYPVCAADCDTGEFPCQYHALPGESYQQISLYCYQISSYADFIRENNQNYQEIDKEAYIIVPVRP